MNETISYYNNNAESFIEGTVNADMSHIYAMFERHCKPNGKVLDFGCGAGRDTKYFLGKGYRVDAIDGSEELCKKASAYTGIPVKHMYFNELNVCEEYDGIWACASILHVAKDEVADILSRLNRALVNGGCLYLSFKYGSFTGMRNGRFFTDLTEETFKEILKTIPSLTLVESAVTDDVRVDRAERWLNLILKKQA